MSRRTWLLFFAALLAACGGTEKTRRTFPVSIEARSSPLLTDSGWTVTLSEAKASLSTVRFFSGKVLITRRWSPMDWLISSAWAHPGHYAQGEALGELLTPMEVDLLSGAPTQWGTASAVTGEYGSLQLGFGAAGLSLAGTATKDGAPTVAFSTTFTPPAPLEGVKFEQVMTTEAGAATILFDLNVILSRVDFSQVGEGASPLDRARPSTASPAASRTPARTSPPGGTEAMNAKIVSTSMPSPSLSLLLLLLLTLAACGGEGTVVFTSWGEDYIEVGMPLDDTSTPEPDGFTDGWTVKYTKFVLVYKDIALAQKTGAVGPQQTGALVLDLTKPGRTWIAGRSAGPTGAISGRSGRIGLR